MLKKIIAIKNVGRFRNSASAGNPELAKYTFIVGANGYGKTTVCAVLRSLQTGDASHILGRKTLGVTGMPTVEFLLDIGPIRFGGATWNARFPNIAIFDGAFVAENIHSGDAVDIEHKRNLYRIIIGSRGVTLAEQDAALAAESRAKTGEVTAVTRAIQPHLPAGTSLETFIAFPNILDVEDQIAAQEQTIEAIQQAGVIRERSPLTEIILPDLPARLVDICSQSIDDIADEAEQHIAAHLAAHGMDADGRNWIADGIDHTTETCPFCGQSIEGLPLIAAYRAVFSERYKSFQREIENLHDQVNQILGDGGIARLEALAARHGAAVEFWSRYCRFDANQILFPRDAIDAARNLGSCALRLMTQKIQRPLTVISIDDEFRSAVVKWNKIKSEANTANALIALANALIDVRKAEAGNADLRTANAELARLKAIRSRHTEAVSKLCAHHAHLTVEKNDIEKQKEEVRRQLDEHTSTVVRPYESRINELLATFNAGFSISETRHNYPGGIATSSYQLVINSTAIEVGDSKTSNARPSFKNTLSSGDRATLALAFFLAYLEREPDLADKIVVFDDPFNSQDSFRRRQTVYEILKIGRRCKQVIVLSHDATFLKQVWDKAPTAERIALTIADHRAQGSKITIIDLDKACQGRTATDIDDLQSHLATGAGNRVDIIRKMRGVLETHCWTTYPAYFQNGQDWLGEIVRKIREGGADHPAQALYDELDQINDYINQYHHGEDTADATPDEIDPAELTGFTKRTLRIVNAIQA